MSSPPKLVMRLYWDACVFLSLIEGTPGRKPHIEAVLDEVDRGGCEIFTSFWSIAEVSFAKAEKDGKALSSATERKIDKLWSPGSPFQLVEVHRSIAEDAKKLVRMAVSKGLPLKPADAIHLATAKRIGAKSFQTYDTFKGKASEISTMCGIKIEEPRVSGKLVWVDDATDDDDVGKPKRSTGGKTSTKRKREQR